MSKHKQLFTFILPLAIFIGLVFFLWVGLQHNPREIPSPLLNKPVPAFTAPSLRHTQLLMTEKDLRGTVTLLNVFATWCIACQAEHSVLVEARRNGLAMRIIGLDYKDQRQKALAWLDHYGDPYDAVIEDPQGSLGITFGVYGTPETFIIDKQGIIRYKFIGVISPDDWKRTIWPEIKKWGE